MAQCQCQPNFDSISTTFNRIEKYQSRCTKFPLCAGLGKETDHNRLIYAVLPYISARGYFQELKCRVVKERSVWCTKLCAGFGEGSNHNGLMYTTLSYFSVIGCFQDLKCRVVEPSKTVSIHKRSRGICSIVEKKKWKLIVPHCSFPVSSAAGLKEEGNYLVMNGWKVRRMIETEEEMRKVAAVQAEAFYEPVIFLQHVFFQFFQAEVLAGLLYRLRNSPPDRYACLVAEPSSEVEQDIVGVVDATVFRDNDVLQHVPGAVEYVYISGIAVLNKFRRQKVATALLKACDVLATLWGFEYLVLRAYEDDVGARQLYTKAGYTTVSSDPAWMSTWIGRRRRVLMVKQVCHESASIH